ncbi:Uncharacterised protein [Vibrio cholerae]|nr:Uncharacterised protein [Vibrio cholerae]
MCQTFIHFTANVVKVRCTATDHTTQRDNRIVVAGFCNTLRYQRQLNRTGTTHNGNVVITDLTVTLKSIDGTRQQTFIDKTVETRNHNRNFRIWCWETTLDHFHKLSFNSVHQVRIAGF